MTLVRLAARPMLSSMFLYGGINEVRNADVIASRAKPVASKITGMINRSGAPIPMEIDEKLLVRADGVIKTLAGLALATGRQPRISALILAATLMPTTVAGHRFWDESDPNARTNQQVHFLKNISLLGGLLLASVDTAGKPSVAWRVRRKAKKLQEHASR
jgi:putative oxidoreductase